jgi:hypothetical protein
MWPADKISPATMHRVAATLAMVGPHADVLAMMLGGVVDLGGSQC